MTNDVKNLALEVFVQYTGYEPGQGAWTKERDENQLTHYIEPLIKMWQRRIRGMENKTIDYANALDVARSLGIFDRPYVLEIRLAYNEVVRGQQDNPEG